jgi:hypothetical protein
MKRREFLGLAGAALISAPKISVAQTTPSKTLRVVVVANRYHEADGLMAVVCNDMARSPTLDTPRNVVWPRGSTLQGAKVIPEPRCLIDVYPKGKDPSDKNRSATMEIWCLDDLMSKQINHGDSGNKAQAMDIITGYGSVPDGVVAFGTAGYPDIASSDGCATIGSTIFIHDASNDGNGTHGNWAWPGYMGTLVPSKTPASFFSSVAADQKILDTISREMLAPQVHPAGVLQLIIAPDAVGISSVNIPDKAPYCDVDSKAIVQAKAAGATNITSVETTHGVIRSKWPGAPFIYATAIPNRVCHFPDEAQSNYAQEFPSSHNAGIALSHVMAYFVGAITP